MLFSCVFLRFSHRITDIFVSDNTEVYEAAKRYFAEIMMPFRTIIAKKSKRLRLSISRYCTESWKPLQETGIYYRPPTRTDQQRAKESGCHSLHFDARSTRKLVGHLVVRLQPGCDCFNSSNSQVPTSASWLYRWLMLLLLSLNSYGAYRATSGNFLCSLSANALRPKLRFASVIGSYGWSSKASRGLRS